METVYILAKSSGGAPKAKFLEIYTISVQSGEMIETAAERVYVLKKGSGGGFKAFFQNL